MSSGHKERMRAIGSVAIPPKGTQARELIENIITKNDTPERRKYLNKLWKKTEAIFTGQQLNGAGHETDQSLRWFQREYNNRIWSHDLRGIERKKIFESDDDRKHLLHRLGAILQDTGTACFAWSLMPNHFHLLCRRQGYPVGRYRACSLMKKAGTSVAHRKKFSITTDSKNNLRVAPNHLDRNFQVEQPDSVWCGNITSLRAMAGWLYLTVIIDLYSRKRVGWVLSPRMKASLVTEAFSMAYWRRKPAKGLIHHSDRGSHAAGGEYKKLLAACGMSVE